MAHKILCAVLIIAVWIGPVGGAAAGQPPSMAVLDLLPEYISAVDGLLLSNSLRDELAGLRRFAVVERSRMYELFSRKGIEEATLCASQACAVRIGKAAAVELVVVGRIEGLDQRRLRIEVSLVDAPAARVLRTVTREVDYDIIRLLQGEMKRIARELADLREEEGRGISWWGIAIGGAAAGLILWLRSGADDDRPQAEPGAAQIIGTFAPGELPFEP